MFKTKIHNLPVLNEMERTDTLIKLNAYYIGIYIVYRFETFKVLI